MMEPPKKNVATSSRPIKISLGDLAVLMDKGLIHWVGNERYYFADDGLLHRLDVIPGVVRRRR
jgi:hypothetical protein